MENSYLKEIDAKIVFKEYKNGNWHLQLNRTIFYPHLVGGQPRDFGTIDGIDLIDVYQEGENIYHVVKDDIYNKDVSLSIDWGHRFDMMQQHSGQHLLSSCFYKLMDADTISFHLGVESAFIDINIHKLGHEEIFRVESLANKIIQSNFPIKSYFLKEEEAVKLPLRSLPPVKNNIRIVEIENIEYNLCGGTHVKNTGEIGLIKIKKSYQAKGNIRVEFVCGKRALEDYSKKTLYINELNQLFSSKDKDIIYKAKSLYSKKDELEKENRSLREELNKYKGESYLNGSQNIHGINYIIKSIDGIDLKAANSIGQYLNKETKLVQIYGILNENTNQFLISRSNDLDIDLRDILNIIKNDFHMKGGGSSQIIQGGTNNPNLEEIMKRFKDEIIKYYYRK